MPSQPKPDERTRKEALETNKREWVKHEQAQGRQPTTRETEKLHNSIAEKVDRENGW